MNRNDSAWTVIERRLRRDAAAEPMPADVARQAIRAVREARAATAEPPALFPLWRWVGAAATMALAAWLLVPRSPPMGAVPFAPAPVAGWSLASVDEAALQPLEREWAGLRTDVQAAADFVAGCLPSVPPAPET